MNQNQEFGNLYTRNHTSIPTDTHNTLAERIEINGMLFQEFGI